MKKYPLILLSLFVYILISGEVFAQDRDSAPQPGWASHVPEEELIQWRRHIHENPELSYQEEQTGQYVENVLRGLGNIEIIKPVKQLSLEF